MGCGGEGEPRLGLVLVRDVNDEKGSILQGAGGDGIPRSRTGACKGPGAAMRSVRWRNGRGTRVAAVRVADVGRAGPCERAGQGTGLDFVITVGAREGGKQGWSGPPLIIPLAALQGEGLRSSRLGAGRATDRSLRARGGGGLADGDGSGDRATELNSGYFEDWTLGCGEEKNFVNGSGFTV